MICTLYLRPPGMAEVPETQEQFPADRGDRYLSTGVFPS
jgi:hypothetical protein